MVNIESWGRNPKSPQSAVPMFWTQNPLPSTHEGSLLPFGLGRSYGDSCLNQGGRLILTRPLNRFIAFDREQGLLSCEAGVSLAEILVLTVPHGWFLPVTPGTKFVTIGGAVANDVHGKNHHRAGSFGRHIECLDLLRSDGNRFPCSPQKNSELFRATIGGLGLTGLILTVSLRLQPIHNPWIESESIKFKGLDGFAELVAVSDKDFEHTVAWIDALARGKALGRGIFIRGNHAGPNHKNRSFKTGSGISIPRDAPAFLLNRFSMKLFNLAYFHKQRRIHLKNLCHYEPFFYPLDSVHHWNRLYGKRGFFQYQCVVPQLDRIAAILETAHRNGVASFLTVLKRFGTLGSPGMMSFPRPGLTLAMDIPANNRAIRFMKEADRIVTASGGALYPAKDARMAPATFQASFPEWQAFRKYIDPAFSSQLWRRVTSTEEREP